MILSPVKQKSIGIALNAGTSQGLFLKLCYKQTDDYAATVDESHDFHEAEDAVSPLNK